MIKEPNDINEALGGFVFDKCVPHEGGLAIIFAPADGVGVNESKKLIVSGVDPGDITIEPA